MMPARETPVQEKRRPASADLFGTPLLSRLLLSEQVSEQIIDRGIACGGVVLRNEQVFQVPHAVDAGLLEHEVVRDLLQQAAPRGAAGNGDQGERTVSEWNPHQQAHQGDDREAGVGRQGDLPVSR